MVNNIRARRGNACVRICTSLQAFIHETDAYSEQQRYTADLQDRAPLQAQSTIQFWLDRESSYKKLSQPALDLVVSPASQACYVEWLFSLCGDLTARKRKRTRMTLYRRVFPKLNRHILHWTQCTEKWSATCFWYCRTAEDTLQRLRFWFLLIYLIISRTTITYLSKLKRKL